MYLLGLFYGTGTASIFSRYYYLKVVLHPEEGIYYYNVIQWGDEDVLLSDDEILNTEYFALYEREEYPEDDDFLFKRARHSQLIDSKKF